MGRELRMVPPNWEHPNMKHRTCKQPMFDKTFEDAAREWKEEFAAWERGERPSYCSDAGRAMEYWEYNDNPPDRAYYRPWRDEEATWFQLWENVSEGTPVSPPFATKEELIDYLVEHGDFWQQADAREGRATFRGRTYLRESAESVVNGGYAPSMIVTRHADGTMSVDTPATQRT